jgi:Metal-dependent hydrolase
MKHATFNILADAYTSYGDYSHADPELMVPGARLPRVIRQINELEADVVGLQEADRSVVEVFEADENWQTFWTPKGRNKPDGCLALVKNGIEVTDYESHLYDDESGHVFQVIRIGQLAVANTHIKWAPADDVDHIGVAQTRQLLGAITGDESAVILADCNDQPGGRVQTMIGDAGFMSMSGERPTALVNGRPVAIDLLAVRGLSGTFIPRTYDLESIPNETCSSDHIPLVAELVAK